MMALIRYGLVALVLIGLSAPLQASIGGADAAWRALQDGGVVAIIRHASAPGTGDPPDFRLDDCATQRNLSADGRAQARRLGEALRARGVRVDAVYSSQWCRCLETARLLEVAPVAPLPALNSFFGRPEQREPQMAELRHWFSGQRFEGVIVLVTHQVVVTALTGVFPASGETVVARPLPSGAVEVIGRLPAP